ncbi:MAG: hypothetical protein QJR08_00580 [Bacillota bacterium]|nr:hypothetical protein [Bacillota bacterium]
MVHLRGLRPEDAPAPGSELRDPATGRAMRAVYAIPVWVAADGEWVVCVGARPADEGQDPGGA